MNHVPVVCDHWQRLHIMLIFFCPDIYNYHAKIPMRNLSLPNCRCIFHPAPPFMEYFCWQAPVIIAEPECRHFIFNLERVKLCPWSSLTRLLQCDRMKCCRNGPAMELLPPVTENRPFIFSQHCGFIYLRVQVKVAPPNTHSLSHTHCSKVNQVAGSGAGL